MSMSHAEKQEAFRQGLLEHRILIQTQVPGIFGHAAPFDAVIRKLEARIDRAVAGEAERVCFPPVLACEVGRSTGHVESFPTLCGSVHSFTGDGALHSALVERVKQGGDWGEFLEQSQVVLVPSACYPLYPTLEGELPPGGKLFDLVGHVFRHEPSDDPTRMQAFRQRENVRLGSADEVAAWCEGWLQRSIRVLSALELPVRLDLATDPFFGRGGRMMKATQRAQELKHEVTVALFSEERPLAITSINNHQDHFGHVFGIHGADGGYAHSACIGFGLERIALALFHTHGFELEGWPAGVRDALEL